MTVYLYRAIDGGKSIDITQGCASIRWIGAVASAGRSAEIDYINSPYDDSYKALPVISTGDHIALLDGTEEIFIGQIFGTQKSSQIGTKTYIAFDMMKNLLESKGQYNFKNTTPEAIATQVCAEAGIPIRFLYPTNYMVTSMLCDQMSLYDIIMAAYTRAYKALGKKFFAMIYKRGFSVYHAKWGVSNFTLSESSNIYESNISESMEGIKNKIKIYDKNGLQIGEQVIEDSIKKYGVFQDVYKVEEGVDPCVASYNMLKTIPTQDIKISAIGDIKCLSNYFVCVSDSATGLYNGTNIEV